MISGELISDLKRNSSSRKEQWSNFLEKYSNIADPDEMSFNKIQDEGETNKETAVMSQETVVQEVINHVEKELESPLKYYFVKGVSARIKNNPIDQDVWTRAFVRELDKLSLKVNKTIIKIYQSHMITTKYAPNKLCSIIETKFKSRLKTFMELRVKHPEQHEKYNKYIRKEWDKLRHYLSEDELCLYCNLVFGTITLTSSNRIVDFQ